MAESPGSGFSKLHCPRFMHMQTRLVGAALAWQIVFFLIARDPLRHRPLMIPSVIEKFTYGVAVGLLVMQERMHPANMIFGGIDLLLGILFVVAYFNTRAESLNQIQGTLDKGQAA